MYKQGHFDDLVYSALITTKCDSDHHGSRVDDSCGDEMPNAAYDLHACAMA